MVFDPELKLTLIFIVLTGITICWQKEYCDRIGKPSQNMNNFVGAITIVWTVHAIP
jgi:hypothetical protein